MAWGLPAVIGTGQNKVSSSTVVLTTTVAVNVDEVAVVVIAADNTSTTDGDNNEVTSVTDNSAGGPNTWTQAREFTNGQGAAAAGATVAVFFSKITTQIANGGTITANFVSARVAKAITGIKATVGAGNVVSVDAGASLAGDASDPASMDLTPPNTEHLWVRGIACEFAGTETFTKTAAYELALTLIGTTGGGSASNMTACGECDRLTGTTNASDPTTGITSDHANVLVALLEAAPPAAGPWVGMVTAMALTGIGH